MADHQDTTTVLVPFCKFRDWYANGQTGLSSKAITMRLSGGEVRRGDSFPHDTADLRRCVLLLEAVPEARDHILAMRDVSPTWARIVEQWDEIEALLREEIDIHSRQWSAPRTYKRMQEIRHG